MHCPLTDQRVNRHFFFQAEDGIRDLVRSRGLGDVYKRQLLYTTDGSEPNKNSQKYTGPFSIDKSCEVKTAIYLSLIHI